MPFEQLIIFSTNLDPKDLVDDAFLRRIRHKVQIHAPTRDVYEKIFNGDVQAAGHEPVPGGGRLPVRALLQAGPHARGPAIAGIYWRSCSRFADSDDSPSS